MASRYASFCRPARNFFASNRNAFARRPRSSPSNGVGTAVRRHHSSQVRKRLIQTMIPLHSAIASSKLVSHLSFNSQSGCALPLGLQGYVHTIPLCITSMIGFRVAG